MDPLPVLIPFVVIGGIMYLFMRQKRERTTNALLRGEIQAGARFATRLDHVSHLGTGGVGGTRGQWISLRGPKRLVVGADAFMISAPQALREFVFTGRESSIRFRTLTAGRTASAVGRFRPPRRTFLIEDERKTLGKLGEAPRAAP